MPEALGSIPDFCKKTNNLGLRYAIQPSLGVHGRLVSGFLRISLSMIFVLNQFKSSVSLKPPLVDLERLIQCEHCASGCQTELLQGIMRRGNKSCACSGRHRCNFKQVSPEPTPLLCSAGEADGGAQVSSPLMALVSPTGHPEFITEWLHGCSDRRCEHQVRSQASEKFK